METTVAYLLDRSSSMQSCRDATIEAFNAYLENLKSEPLGVEFTFLQFDTQSLDKLYVAAPLSDVRPLSVETFVPRGGTPLIDAAVKTIRAVEAAAKGKVIVCIQTDGAENSSTEHTWEELRALIAQKQADGWQFNFMGAGAAGDRFYHTGPSTAPALSATPALSVGAKRVKTVEDFKL